MLKQMTTKLADIRQIVKTMPEVMERASQSAAGISQSLKANGVALDKLMESPGKNIRV